MLRSGFFAMVLSMSAHAAVADDAGLPPTQALEAGYSQHTFSTSRFDYSNVDLGGTYERGFQWYLTNYFGTRTPANAVKVGANGVMTTLNPQDASNNSVASIAASKDAPYYVGTAFGCGAYITADIAFDADSVDNHHGFPSWWTMSAEHLLSLKDQQWPNQPPDFQHFGEVDIFEFNRTQGEYPFSYGASLHEWFGIYNKTCGSNGGFCSVNTGFSRGTVSLPLFTDFSEFHSIGMLWTPATEKDDGKISFFFDQRKVGQSVNWSSIATTTPSLPPPLDPWKFEILDRQHLALIFGSGSGALNVRSVDVWQDAKACNLTN